MVPFSLFPPSRKLLCSTRRLSSSDRLIKAKLEPGGLHGEAKDSPYRNQCLVVGQTDGLWGEWRNQQRLTTRI